MCPEWTPSMYRCMILAIASYSFMSGGALVMNHILSVLVVDSLSENTIRGEAGGLTFVAMVR